MRREVGAGILGAEIVAGAVEAQQRTEDDAIRIAIVDADIAPVAVAIERALFDDRGTPLALEGTAAQIHEQTERTDLDTLTLVATVRTGLRRIRADAVVRQRLTRVERGFAVTGEVALPVLRLRATRRERAGGIAAGGEEEGLQGRIGRGRRSGGQRHEHRNSPGRHAHHGHILRSGQR